MALKFYNTMAKKKEIFKPLKKSVVTMYTCGPTVYNFAHVGNFRAYLASDILKRYLKYGGLKVKQVMNLTDVDDKTIRDSQKEGISLKEFTEKYITAFFEDLESLNIDKADFFPKATEHIDGMVALVLLLMEKGYAYKGEDGSIYFDISKFKNYGKLSGFKIKSLKSGARVKQDEYTKSEARDFALWKAWDENDGDVFWENELGKGRPGWHLECSVMSVKYLGEPIDIHAGGVDLIFPHHENEIAQTEAASGKKFANYWFHNEWLLVEGKKMSKSLGNFYTLRDLINKGYSPKAIRYVLINSHYRSQMNLTDSALKDAETTINRLLEFMDKLDEVSSTKNNKEVPKLVKSVKEKFEKVMDDDLNMPLAIAAIQEFVTRINKVMGDISKKDANSIKKIMLDFDKVLGILEREKTEIPKEIKKLISDRETARTKKDFKKSDELRDEIRKLGWEVQDSPSGQKLRKRI